MNVKSEEARKAQAEYMREYRRRNPDKIREANRRYWEKKAKKQEAAKDADNGKAGA